MDFGDWEGSSDVPDDLGGDMTARDIADAVLKQPPADPKRFEKLARLVGTTTKMQAVVELLPYEMRAGIVAGLRGKVT